MAGESLVDREFTGTVLKDKDTKHQGQYKVSIPELFPHMKETKGVWCKNHTSKYRVTPSQHGVYGSYYPLHPGTAVIVKFFANHIESGYIDRIISDAYIETLPYEIIERDDYYQIIRTPRYNNLICIYEGPPPPPDADGKEEPWTKDNAQPSKNVPKNSIHVYFNDTRTTVVIDETGINVKTLNNINITVDEYEGTPGNIKINVKGTADINVVGNTNITTAADANIKATGKVNVQAGGDANVKAAGKVNVDAVGDANVNTGANANITAGAVANIKGATVNIQGDSGVNIKGGPVNIQGAPVSLNGSAGPATAAGAAGDATPAALAALPILITPRSDYKYFKQSSGK